MTPDQILEKLKSLRGTMSTSQLVSLVASFVGVMGAVIAFAFWLNQPTYRVLFSDMDAESASAVTERLRAQDVRFRITDGGRSIQVPADQLDQLRLDFAGAGLPQSGRLGFELFDRTQFGATEFLEGVTYRRALEGEIARTLASIAEVSSARVHIAMAKDSLFQAKEQPAKASVVLRLKSSMPLSPRTVTGIRRLVAFGVEGLRPELVTILDTQGRPLTNDDGGDDAPLGATQMERQQQSSASRRRRWWHFWSRSSASVGSGSTWPLGSTSTPKTASRNGGSRPASSGAMKCTSKAAAASARRRGLRARVRTCPRPRRPAATPRAPRPRWPLRRRRRPVGRSAPAK